jgi:hypothetical protein
MTRGTDGGLGLSMSLGVTYHVSVRGRSATVPTTFYVDALTFAVGRAEVALTTTTLGQPFPAELEAGLFSRLVSRAVAARRAYPAVDR